MDESSDHTRPSSVAGEVPVGAVIVDASGNLIAEAENRRERDKDHSSCRNSRSAGNWSSLAKLAPQPMHPLCHFRTLPMCSHNARAGSLVYGADDPKTGAHCCQHSDDSACLFPICTRRHFRICLSSTTARLVYFSAACCEALIYLMTLVVSLTEELIQTRKFTVE